MVDISDNSGSIPTVTTPPPSTSSSELQCLDCGVNFKSQHYLYSHLRYHVKQPRVVLERQDLSNYANLQRISSSPPIRLTIKGTKDKGFQVVPSPSTSPTETASSASASDNDHDNNAQVQDEEQENINNNNNKISLSSEQNKSVPIMQDDTEKTNDIFDNLNLRIEEIAKNSSTGGVDDTIPIPTDNGYDMNAKDPLEIPGGEPTPPPEVNDATAKPMIRVKSNLMKETNDIIDEIRTPGSMHSDTNNILSTLFTNNDRARDLGFTTIDPDYNPAMDNSYGTVANRMMNSNPLASLNLPMEQLAEQVSRLQKATTSQNGVHQQNVLINIQQFPQAPPPPQTQMPQMAQYHHQAPGYPAQRPPPPMYHHPQAQAPPPGPMQYQPYPPTNIYYPQGPLPPQHPPPHPPNYQHQHQQMHPMQRPPQQPQYNGAYRPVTAAPPQQQQQQYMQQRPSWPPQPARMPAPTSTHMNQQQQQQQQRAVGAVHPTQSQRTPQISQQQRGPRPNVPVQATSSEFVRMVNRQGNQQSSEQIMQRQRMPPPKQPLRRMPSNMNTINMNAIAIKREGAAANTNTMNKRPKLTGSNDDDCQVIAVTQKNRGPQVQSVQGNVTEPLPHIHNDVTVSLRTPPPPKHTPPPPESNSVADVLASRGITVTTKQNKNSTAQIRLGTPEPPPEPVQINLNSSVSIIPKKKDDNRVSTVDLTDEERDLATRTDSEGAFQCHLCPSRFTTNELLLKHRRFYHRTNNVEEFGIPLVDLKVPGVMQRLAAVGINHYIPLPHSGDGQNMFSLPIISSNNPGITKLNGTHDITTTMLCLGPIKPIATRQNVRGRQM